MKGTLALVNSMPTPDEILDAAPKGTRVIQVEANVVAYFGDFFHAWKEGVKKQLIYGPVKSGHTAPSSTASAQSPS